MKKNKIFKIMFYINSVEISLIIKIKLKNIFK